MGNVVDTKTIKNKLKITLIPLFHSFFSTLHKVLSSSYPISLAISKHYQSLRGGTLQIFFNTISLG